jgi:hypothetical protein
MLPLWCFEAGGLILTQSSATASARCRKWMSGRHAFGVVGVGDGDEINAV